MWCHDLLYVLYFSYGPTTLMVQSIIFLYNAILFHMHLGAVDILTFSNDLHSFRKYLKTRREELISFGLHLAFEHKSRKKISVTWAYVYLWCLPKRLEIHMLINEIILTVLVALCEGRFYNLNNCVRFSGFIFTEKSFLIFRESRTNTKCTTRTFD